MLQAQEATGRTYESARREAELILKEAESKAAKIVEQANSDLARKSSEIMQLGARRESLIGRLRVLLSSELDLIKTLEMGGDVTLGASSSMGTGKESIELERIAEHLNNDRPTETH